MNIIADLFKDYQEKVIPDNASTIQVEECKRAFYAGAHDMFNVILELMSEGEEVTERDLEIVEQIHIELESFIQSLIVAESN